ncbi:MAG: hypothetical protein ACKPEY_16725 [Planctomycetota bacterium]
MDRLSDGIKVGPYRLGNDVRGELLKILTDDGWLMITEQGWLIAHWVCALFMVGLIWFVQVVHYPLMAHVGRDAFPLYSQLHQFWTTWVVAGPMLGEVLTLGMILYYRPERIASPAFGFATLLLVVVWISTAAVQVPLHGKLLAGYDETTIQKLVLTNWVRTIAWSLRGVALGFELFGRR